MNKITLAFTLAISSLIFGQDYVDMSAVLSNVNGHLVIDGNDLQHKRNTKEQIIITGKDLVLNDRSSFVFNNVILQLSGRIIVKGKVKSILLSSHIFCKDSGVLKSDKIIEVKNLDDIYIGNVEYIKNLQGNPELWVYNSSGKRIFRGTKKEAASFQVPISKYDVKVVGVGFKSNVLFKN